MNTLRIPRASSKGLKENNTLGWALRSLIGIAFLLWLPPVALSESSSSTKIPSGRIPLGSKPPHLVLSGADGGRIDGKPWDSASIQNNVWMMFYVDPDQRNENLDFEKALKSADFDHSKVKSIGMINFAATWLPDMVLASSLEAKQKEYPDTIYVKDLTKKTISAWKLEDDAYNFLVFNAKGELIAYRSGRVSDADTKEIVALIKKNLTGDR